MVALQGIIMSNTAYALTHKSIRIGHSIGDLLACVKYNKYLILNGPPPPIFLHSGFDPSLPLGSIWSNLYWSLLFSGKVYPSVVDSITLSTPAGSMRLKTPTGSHLIDTANMKVEISSIEKIDDIHEFAEVTESPDFCVYDVFACKRGSVHDRWFVDFDEKSNLAKEVYFFISDRIDGNKNRKDLAVKSILSRSELMEFSNSDTMVRFKVEERLPSKIGIGPGHMKLRHLTRIVNRSYGFSLGFSPLLNIVKVDPINSITELEYRTHVSNE